VRENIEWKAGHIRGAVQLELYKVFSEARLSEVVAKDKEVVIYSLGPLAIWPHSARACATAVSWGFKKVYYFREGFPGWNAAGYPVEVPSG